MAEAKKAVQPFTLDFEVVDWWTAYSVGQRLASTYRAGKGERVLIAGDAAHTHSSAAAQGMNTGMHDAVNLIWKLAGYVKGWFGEGVLESYTRERSIAEKIIQHNSIVAMLTTGGIPEQFRGVEGFDRSKTLTEIYRRNQGINSGLTIRYPVDGCTVVEGSEKSTLKVSPGERALDVLVQRPGIRLPLRLYSLFKNVRKFTVILFCGHPEKTMSSLNYGGITSMALKAIGGTRRICSNSSVSSTCLMSRDP